ncbi:hypothetical protein V1Y59_07955 [Gordonia sp. PKS22-38]|uniref:Uncharacterized protein n=1 Tax=Gordonia prachuapensis TaxID=3115651 RepID=A0ABU7MSA3_9ACTN|nr:hypothetical protein [Gordonia sp. PKS22-38]
MDAQQAGAFDKKAFIAAVKEAIEAKSPKTLSEADKFAESGKAGEAKSDIKGLVSQGKQGQAKDITAATAAPPDSSVAVPKPVTPMEPERQDAAPLIPSGGAAPKPAPPEQLNLEAGKRQTDQELSDAEVDERQLAESNEPQFQQALVDKKEAAAHADTAPSAFRAHEADVIAASKANAAGQTKAGILGMQGTKAASLAGLVAAKAKTKSKDETERAAVTARVQAIFTATENDVKKLLDGIDPKVEKAFDEGEATARRRFETFVAAKMSAYKKDRYSGWLGGLRWAKDKLVGMPDKVNRFYEAGRELYLKQMDVVISGVADIVGNDLGAAKKRIAAGKAQIASYVRSLPSNLRKVGAAATAEINDRFERLEDDVNAKKDAVVDTLATKYVEARSGLDERIEELQAENKGLVDKAIGAIKAVINTIRKLASMLMNTLARVAHVVGDIIKHPVRFLGNLIDGVKGGILRFKENILDHLRKGLMNWLFGALAEGGVELPDSFDLKGIVKLLASIFGLTWRNIRTRLVKQIGEPAMGAVEKGVDVFRTIATAGVAGLWQLLVDKLGDIKEMILEHVKDFVVTRVITAGITWLIGLLNPAAAFIKACKLIYDIVMFFVNNAERILAFVNTVIDSAADIVRGNVSGVVAKIEDALGQMVPVLIGFLASVIGLGGIGQKIRSIIDRLRKPVTKALDAVIAGGLKLARPIIAGLKGIGGKVKGKVAAGREWVKGKFTSGKKWVKDKVEALTERYQASFVVRRPQGVTEKHTVTTTVGRDGRVQTVVASDPTPIDRLVEFYRSRSDRLPDKARRAATRAIAGIERWTAHLSAPNPSVSRERATNEVRYNLRDLLEVHAKYGQPERRRMAEEPRAGQQMTVRITVLVPPGGLPLEKDGASHRGAGTTWQPRGKRKDYELFDRDEALPTESSTKPRGGVYAAAAGRTNTTDIVQQREIVTHGWAGGGRGYFENATGHTESQFMLFLKRQGDAFLARICAIEIKSHYSACGDCTHTLMTLRHMLDEHRAPRNPSDPEGPKIQPALLTFAFDEPFQPAEDVNLPNRQVLQTRQHHLDELRKGHAWFVNGPALRAPQD